MAAALDSSYSSLYLLAVESTTTTVFRLRLMVTFRLNQVYSTITVRRSRESLRTLSSGRLTFSFYLNFKIHCS